LVIKPLALPVGGKFAGPDEDLTSARWNYLHMTISSTNILSKWLHGIVLLLLTTLAAADAIPPGKAVITLMPKFGPVTFSHQHHSELEAVECVTCHHTLESTDEPIRSCYSCHEAQYYSIARITKAEPETAEADTDESQIRNAHKAFHGLCIGCHKQRREQKQPTGPDDSCRDCHQ